MKTITLFFFTVFAITMTTNAQITEGNWLVGGTGKFSSSNVKDENGRELGSSSGITLFPNIGYFFADKFAAGLIGQFNYGKVKNGSSNVGYGIGPFARYYFLKTDNLINVLVEGSFVYNTSSTDEGNSSNGNIYAFKAGPVLYFNSSVGLELTVNYTSSKYADSYQSNQFLIGLGFQIHLEK